MTVSEIFPGQPLPNGWRRVRPGDVMIDKAWVHFPPEAQEPDFPFLIPSGLLLKDGVIGHVVRSRVSSPGIYLLSDTGAGTVDQSVFIFIRQNEDQSEHLTYLHGGGIFPSTNQ